jgi:hypothetical protein
MQSENRTIFFHKLLVYKKKDYQKSPPPETESEARPVAACVAKTLDPGAVIAEEALRFPQTAGREEIKKCINPVIRPVSGSKSGYPGFAFAGPRSFSGPGWFCAG